MKKILLLGVAAVIGLTGCAGSKAGNSVSYADYKRDVEHDLELVSDKHFNEFSACVRAGLASYSPSESAIDNGTKISKPGDFSIEIYRAIDSTYARVDSKNSSIVNAVQRCK